MDASVVIILTFSSISAGDFKLKIMAFDQVNDIPEISSVTQITLKSIHEMFLC